MGVSMYRKYPSGITIAPKGRTTHTLNDLLLGKPKDKRHFIYMGLASQDYFKKYVKGSYQ